MSHWPQNNKTLLQTIAGSDFLTSITSLTSTASTASTASMGSMASKAFFSSENWLILSWLISLLSNKYYWYFFVGYIDKNLNFPLSLTLFSQIHSEAAEATWGIFFSNFFSLDQKSARQDHPKNNYLILNSKFKPHKLFKVSSFAFVHPVYHAYISWKSGLIWDLSQVRSL